MTFYVMLLIFAVGSYKAEVTELACQISYVFVFLIHLDCLNVVNVLLLDFRHEDCLSFVDVIFILQFN